MSPDLVLLQACVCAYLKIVHAVLRQCFSVFQIRSFSCEVRSAHRSKVLTCRAIVRLLEVSWEYNIGAFVVTV